MAPICLRTYSRKASGPKQQTSDTHRKALPMKCKVKRNRLPLKTIQPTAADDFDGKPPRNLFNAILGICNDDSVVVRKASKAGLEDFPRHESSESSLGISVDTTFDKLLKGMHKFRPKVNEPAMSSEELAPRFLGQRLSFEDVIDPDKEKEVPPIPLQPYSLELHTTDDEFSSIPQGSGIKKKVGLLVKKSPHHFSYQLRPRTQTKYYLSKHKLKDVTNSLSSSSSFAKTSSSKDSGTYESPRQREEASCVKSDFNGEIAIEGKARPHSTSTPLGNKLSCLASSNPPNWSPIPYHEHCSTTALNVSSQIAAIANTESNMSASSHTRNTNHENMAGSSSPKHLAKETIDINAVVSEEQHIKIVESLCPEGKEVCLPVISPDSSTSSFGSPFKGWGSQTETDVHLLGKLEECFNSSIDLFVSYEMAENNVSFEECPSNSVSSILTLATKCKHSLGTKVIKTSKAEHVASQTSVLQPTNASNVVQDSSPVFDEEASIFLPGTTTTSTNYMDSRPTVSTENLSNVLNAKALDSKFKCSTLGIISLQHNNQNVLMSTRSHPSSNITVEDVVPSQLRWCIQPMRDLSEDEDALDAIEEEGDDDLPVLELFRGSCLKRLKSPSQYGVDRHISSMLRWDTTRFSSRRSSMYGGIPYRKSRQSHCVIPGKLLAQPKKESLGFRGLHGIAALETEALILSRELDEDGTTCDKDDNGRPITARDVVLRRCHQDAPVTFSEAFSESYLNNCKKIGEGVYGEVFMWRDGDRSSVIKIIPIEGDDLINGERQKKFSEILSEIVITTELSNLRHDSENQTNGFTEVLQNWCIQDKYPDQLITLWEQYSEERQSENDCPDVFSESQLFIVIELANGGEDLEKFEFNNAKQSKSILLQTAYALAVAEKSLEFEHRDLHWGNVLISRTKEKCITYKLDDIEHSIPSHGVQVTIIDFTLSRMTYDGCCIFNDLALDPGLFESHGDYQFDIYRKMRETCCDSWNEFVPFTNVLWLHYLVDKMTAPADLGAHYRNKKTKVHQEGIGILKNIQKTLLSSPSAKDFVEALDVKMKT